jgi:hypothetical protein
MIKAPAYRLWINPFSAYYSVSEKLFFLLRLGMLGCFVGHGAWGIMLKKSWLPFFHLFGISDQTAFTLMPLVGIMDILIGVIAFVRPNRALLFYALFWSSFTAALRPACGMGFSEFFERAGNFGLPLLLLALFNKPKSLTDLFQPLGIPALTEHRWNTVERISRIAIFSLLAGHAGLALFVDKHPVLWRNFSFVFQNHHELSLFVTGIIELGVACLFIWKPKFPGLIVFILCVKVFTEVLHPIAGNSIEIFETIERMGDFILPLVSITIGADFVSKQKFI